MKKYIHNVIFLNNSKILRIEMYTFIFEYINKKLIKIRYEEEYVVVHLFLKSQTSAQTKSIKQTNW